MKKLLLLALFVLLLPTASQASGTLVKSPSFSAVYYLGTDGKRYVFPNENVYKSWYGDFSGVTTITDAELYASPIGGNVTYKPGSKMVKITTDPKVYAVDRNGTLRWIVGEDVATSLYGSDWAQNVNDIPDAFFVNYRVGSPITSVSDFSPVERMSVASISEDKTLGGIGAVDEPVTVAPVQQPAQTTNTQTAPALQIVKFQSDKTTVKPGETFKLSWEATGATTCALTKDLNSITIPFTGHLPSGETPAYGLENLGTFHLVCADKDWNTTSKSVAVTANNAAPTFIQEPSVTVTLNNGIWSATLNYQTDRKTTVTGMPSALEARTNYSPTLQFTDQYGLYVERDVQFATGAGQARLEGLARITPPPSIFNNSVLDGRMVMSNSDAKDVDLKRLAFEVTSSNITFTQSSVLEISDDGIVFFNQPLQNGIVESEVYRIINKSTSYKEYRLRVRGVTQTAPGNSHIQIKPKEVKLGQTDVTPVWNPEMEISWSN